MDERRNRLRALAAGQDAQFATAQARGLGLNRNALRALRDAGEIGVLRRGVWRFTVAPAPADPAVTAFLLCWPDGVISHRSAGRRHGLTRLDEPSEPEIVMPLEASRRPSGVRVHLTRALPAHDVLVLGGVRYTTVARTVCDLAAGRDAWDVLGILDDAVALGASPRWIHRRARSLAGGRGGVALLRDATGPDGRGTFRSWLERVAAHVYRAAGIPQPEWNVPVHDARGLIGVVDALWRRWHVIAEKEGLRFHSSPERRRCDARRFNRLCEGGYVPRIPNEIALPPLAWTGR